MGARRESPRMQFSEMFAAAEMRGIHPLAAADALLQRLIQPGQIIPITGLRRDYLGTAPSRIPRDPHPRPVPKTAWTKFSRVESDATSRWVDDPDGPEEYASADWFAGTLEIGEWIMEPEIDFLYSRFSALSLPTRAVEQLFSEMEGRAPAKLGAPRGPRSDDEAQAVNRVIEVKRGGDPRSLRLLSGLFLAKELTADGHEAARNRVYDHARRLWKKAATNSPP